MPTRTARPAEAPTRAPRASAPTRRAPRSTDREAHEPVIGDRGEVKGTTMAAYKVIHWGSGRGVVWALHSGEVLRTAVVF
jgi:hypothetical protein